MCDEFEEYHEEGSMYTLKKGTILYSGNRMNRDIVSLKDVFNYVGQRGIDAEVENYVLYASSDFNVAWGYASSCQLDGYIHKFKVTLDVDLLEGDVFEDAELIDQCVCSPYEYRGYAVIYAPGKDEYALCNSSDYLEYVSSIKCGDDVDNWIDLDLYSDTVGMSAYDLSSLV